MVLNLMCCERYLVMFGGPCLLAVCATVGSSATRSVAAADGAVRLQHCLITAVDDVQVASHRAGLITLLHVKEGAHVEHDAAAAQIDDAEAKLNVEEMHANLSVGQTRAASTLETEYAIATHRTAEQEHKISTSVNEKLVNSVSVLEIERLQLAAQQAFIKIAVAKQQKLINGLETNALEAKVKLAEALLRQHQIRAPIDGEVVEIYLRVGEWVEAGKPVLRIVRLDHLRVEGFVKVRDLLPQEIMARPVRVEVELARGKKLVFEGKVAFVSPLVQPGGEYRVWAEVQNRRDDGQWVLRPGMEAEMTIGE